MKYIGNNYIIKDTLYDNSLSIKTTDHGSDPDKFLTIGSTGRVTYRTGAEVFSDIGAAAGDITQVRLTADDTTSITFASGDANFTVAGGSGITTSNSSTTLTVAADTASTTARGVVELATTAETTTGTDTGRVVTPDGLKDGYQGSTNVTTLGTIATGVWEGTTLAIDQGGTGNTTGVQGGKNYRILNTSFRQDIGTTKYYLPLKSQDEQTVLTREEVSELAVCDGRIVSVSLRVENLNTHTGDATVTFGVEANTVGSAYNAGFSVVETESLTINNSDDHHLFHYVFDTAKHWDSTDMWAVSLQSDTDISGGSERFFVTVVVEDDWSTYLGGSSREIDTTP